MNNIQWTRSRDRLLFAVTSLGFPAELGGAIAKNLGSPKAMDRMTSYLEYLEKRFIRMASVATISL